MNDKKLWELIQMLYYDEAIEGVTVNLEDGDVTVSFSTFIDNSRPWKISESR